MQQEDNLTVDENSKTENAEDNENIEEGQTEEKSSDVVTDYEDETYNDEQNVSMTNDFENTYYTHAFNYRRIKNKMNQLMRDRKLRKEQQQRKQKIMIKNKGATQIMTARKPTEMKIKIMRKNMVKTTKKGIINNGKFHYI